MTNCAEIEPLLYLYREGELSPEDQARVDAHIQTCISCAAIHTDLKVSDDAMRLFRVRSVETLVPSSAVDAVLTRISAHSPTPRPRTNRGAETKQARGDSVTRTSLDPAQITGPKGRRLGVTVSPAHTLTVFLQALDRFLRPALEAGLVAALLLLCVQGVRDARLMTQFEERVTIQSDHALQAAADAEQAIARYQRDESHAVNGSRLGLASILQPFLPSAAPISSESLERLLRSPSPDAQRVVRILHHALPTER